MFRYGIISISTSSLPSAYLLDRWTGNIYWLIGNNLPQKIVFSKINKSDKKFKGKKFGGSKLTEQQLKRLFEGMSEAVNRKTQKE